MTGKEAVYTLGMKVNFGEEGTKTLQDFAHAKSRITIQALMGPPLASMMTSVLSQKALPEVNKYWSRFFTSL